LDQPVRQEVVIGGGDRQAVSQTAAPSLVAQIPRSRAGTPDGIAQMAAAALSKRFGRYVVGTTIDVDGDISLISWIPPAVPGRR